MSEDIRKNISLIGKKINVLIVGGGKAGFIKAKSFLNGGCKVTVVSKEYDVNFDFLSSSLNYENKLILISGEYNENLIKDKHIIAIAIKNDELRKNIISQCESSAKLFLDCTDYENGNLTIPVQGETETLKFSINTKSGNPKLTLFLKDELEEELLKYDSYVKHVCLARENLKDSEAKNDILSKITTKKYKEKFELGLGIDFSGDIEVNDILLE